VTLAQHGRLAEALLYARAALSNYESFGDRAADKISRAQGLIAMIEVDVAHQQGGGNA
jgi:hypothetical protein